MGNILLEEKKFIVVLRQNGVVQHQNLVGMTLSKDAR